MPFDSTARAPKLHSRLWLAVVALAWGGVALALVLQFGLDMQPCAWCTLQRLIYIVIGAVGLWGWWRSRSARALVPAMVGLGLVGFGLYAALYQHFIAAKSDSCAMTLADKIIKTPGLDQWAPWMFKATAFCNEANLPWLGVPFALWSVALFAVLGLAMAWTLKR
jgi:disulfide bond formation protein DsbB